MENNLTPFQITRMKTLQQKNTLLKNQIKNKYKEVRLQVHGKSVGPVVLTKDEEMPISSRLATMRDTIVSAKSPERSVLSRLKTYSVASKASMVSKNDIFVTDFSKELETLPCEYYRYSSVRGESRGLPSVALSNFKGRPVNMSLNKTDASLLEDLKVSKLKLKIPKKYKY
jgi:hypothetical protein